MHVGNKMEWIKCKCNALRAAELLLNGRYCLRCNDHVFEVNVEYTCEMDFKDRTFTFKVKENGMDIK